FFFTPRSSWRWPLVSTGAPANALASNGRCGPRGHRPGLRHAYCRGPHAVVSLESLDLSSGAAPALGDIGRLRPPAERYHSPPLIRTGSKSDTLRAGCVLLSRPAARSRGGDPG